MMNTIRLFDQDVDIREFDAEVCSCRASGDHWEVVLDQTAFFPEGGGQGADQGMLGNVRVLDTREPHEQKGTVVHFTDGPLEEGSQVHGVIDGTRRLDMMQQHTGEHIYTGIVHRLYGYDNVGFHIGKDSVRLDFNGPLTDSEARRIEEMANEAVWANLPVVTLLPTREELANLEYRSKKEIEGTIRIVHIPGIDDCACCGTHVRFTGSVGQIKVISVQKYKEGVRVLILCGRRALEYENGIQDQIHRAGMTLSAKQEEVADAVERLLADRDAIRFARDGLAMKLFDVRCAEEQSKEIRVVSCELPGSQLRKSAGRLAEGAKLGLVLSKKEGGWNFAMSSAVQDIRPVTKALCSAFKGKGGGPADMTQGTLSEAKEEAIREFLESM